MNLRLRHKIYGTALIPPVVIVTIIVAAVIIIGGSVEDEAKDVLDHQLRANLTQIVKDVENMCHASHSAALEDVRHGLSAAEKLLEKAGGARLDDRTVRWSAMNQFTKQTNDVSLPRMLIGGTWLGRNGDADRRTPLVDEVVDMVGGTVTVFQRMNDAGDMLRVGTNVIKNDGTRAIGTYIPAVNPDGSRNAVVSTVMSGETYNGRAYVVNAWYTTAYSPLRDRSGRIIGMLYAGVREDAGGHVRDAILKTTVGQTGYVFIIGGQGDTKGHYLISKDGARDGENIWEAKDADGKLFIQSMVNGALALKEGEVGFETYPWLNKGDSEPRLKISGYSYYEPWGWVIGAGMYHDEGLVAQRMVSSAFGKISWTSILIGLLALALTGFGATLLVRRIAGPMEKVTGAAQAIAKGDVEQTVDHESSDEIGQMAAAFRELIEATKTKADAAERIAHGDLDFTIPQASDRDVLGRSMRRMREGIERLVQDAKQLADAAAEGQLSVRADASHHEGDYRSIVEGMNRTLDAVASPLAMASEAIDKISRGDIPEHLEQDCQGDYCILRDALNRCIDAVNRMVDDTKRLATAAAAGQLNERADADQHEGDFRVITEGFNRTLDALVTPLQSAAACMEQISRGQAPDEIQEEWKGDFDQLKKALNRSIRAINSLIGDTKQLAEAATAGDLTARADASHHRGDFQQIIVGINNTLEAVVAPITEAHEVLEKIAARDLTARIQGDYKGDHAAIKLSINKMGDDLAQAIGSIAMNSKSLASASEELNAVSSEMDRSASTASMQSDEAHQSAISVKDNVTVLSTSAQEMTSAIREIAQNASQAAEISSSAVSTADHAAGTVSALAAASQEIGQIAALITSIAEQTNLLALNATIEAARAGEAGKGFAVVAGEVKGLAEETAKATESIGKTIASIQTQSTDAEKAIREIDGVIRRIDEISSAIASAVDEQASITQEMTNNVNHASGATESISSNVGQVLESVQSTAAGAQQTQASASELARMATELDSLVGSFRY